MDSKTISISMPLAMLKKIDEAAARSYQSRSNFIRMAVVEKFGAKSQFELVSQAAPDMHSDREILKMYDYEEEFRETMEQ